MISLKKALLGMMNSYLNIEAKLGAETENDSKEC
jgi:hypothetical protein